jgi:hypothetical protein
MGGLKNVFLQSLTSHQKGDSEHGRADQKGGWMPPILPCFEKPGCNPTAPNRILQGLPQAVMIRGHDFGERMIGYFLFMPECLDRI